MKRIVMLFLVLMFLCPAALADTLREQANAPTEFKGTFDSPSGISHIYVDAQVIVPDAENIPIYQVFARIPDEMEFKQLADLVYGEDGYTLEMGKADESNPAGFTYEEEDPASLVEGLHRYSISTELCPVSLIHQQEDYSEVKAFYGIYDYPENTYFIPHLYYYADEGNYGKNLPPEAEAKAAADAIVSKVFPDFYFWGSEPEKSMDKLRERVGCGELWDYGYRFYYTRVLNNIPVSYVCEQGGDTDGWDASYAPVPPYEKLFIDVGENGIFQIAFQYPLRIGEVISEAELLPFDQIMDIFSRVAPLSIAASELNSKFEGRYINNLYIKEIRLGYMCTMDRDHPERHVLVPVWDFYGDREFRDDYYDWANQSHFTINAMDGTVIDRTYGY